jgi:hypothetical protein
MSSLLIRAEDWDKMAQSGRVDTDGGAGSRAGAVVRPAGPVDAAGSLDPVAVAELLVVLARAREVEQQLQTCIEQIQTALAHTPGLMPKLTLEG